jgi:hypothetical protein
MKDRQEFPYRVVVCWTDALGFPGKRSKHVQAQNAHVAIELVEQEISQHVQAVEFRKAQAKRL